MVMYVKLMIYNSDPRSSGSRRSKPPAGRRASAMQHADYADALRKSLLFYRAQRSGAIEAHDNPIPWRRSSFLSDGADVGVDLSGGYCVHSFV